VASHLGGAPDLFSINGIELVTVASTLEPRDRMTRLGKHLPAGR
jgi:hypothetical protein